MNDTPEFDIEQLYMNDILTLNATETTECLIPSRAQNLKDPELKVLLKYLRKSANQYKKSFLICLEPETEAAKGNPPFLTSKKLRSSRICPKLVKNLIIENPFEIEDGHKLNKALCDEIVDNNNAPLQYFFVNCMHEADNAGILGKTKDGCIVRKSFTMKEVEIMTYIVLKCPEWKEKVWYIMPYFDPQDLFDFMNFWEETCKGLQYLQENVVQKYFKVQVKVFVDIAMLPYKHLDV